MAANEVTASAGRDAQPARRANAAPEPPDDPRIDGTVGALSRRRRHDGSNTVAFALALGAHAALFALMPTLSSLEALQRLATVDLELVAPPSPPEPPPPEAEPEPEPETPPEPEPPPRPRPRPRAPEPPPPTQAEPPPPAPEPAPAEETPVRMDGVTLTSPGAGPGFAVDPGSGEDRQGPLSPPGVPTGRRRRGVPGGQPGGTGTAPGPRVVPLADLSRPPEPPNLDARLVREYPERARRQGVTGTATLRARVAPNGRVDSLRGATASVAGYGFEEACENVLRGSRWSPPLDRRGQPVAVWITYRCRFSTR